LGLVHGNALSGKLEGVFFIPNTREKPDLVFLTRKNPEKDLGKAA
jgi:hypothetical protein